MTIKDKMNAQFKNVEGGLFQKVSKADVGDGAAKFIESGGINMAWADMYSPSAFLPESVKKAMSDALESETISHYVMPIGDSNLRKTIADKIRKSTNLDIDWERHVIITPGSDSALFYAMMPFLEKEDEVLVPDPSYPSNEMNARLLGAKAVQVPLYREDNYQFRLEELEKRVTTRTKMVLITHPNNPTTSVFRKENLELLSRFVIEHDLILVSDQAFEDHIYDGIEFVSPCTLPGMWERTLTVCSISKGYGLSGLRIGYIYGSDQVMDVLYGAAVNVLGAANTLASIGAKAAIEDKSILQENYKRLLRRRNLVYSILGQGIPGVSMEASESGILTWINVQRLGTSEEVASYLMEHANVMVNPGNQYGQEGEGYLRIVTACIMEDEKATEYLNAVKKALIELGKQRLGEKMSKSS